MKRLSFTTAPALAKMLRRAAVLVPMILWRLAATAQTADGTAGNWIGHFLEPHPRNLTDPKAMAGMTRGRLRTVIRDGLPGTTMSAWKSVLSDDQIDALIAYIDRAFLKSSGN